MRIDQQISPASSSSSSSGLIADIDINTKRPGRESELEVAVQKLKDMSITETKGKKNWATLSANALVLLFIRSVIGAGNSHHTFNQSKVKWNQPRLGHSRFPALSVVCSFLLWILIGYLWYLPLFWLAAVITLGLVVRQPIKMRLSICSVFLAANHYSLILLGGV